MGVVTQKASIAGLWDERKLQCRRKKKTTRTQVGGNSFIVSRIHQ